MEFRTELPKAEAVFRGDTMTLAGLRTYDDLSDETTAFSATLRRNGRKVAEASNDGRGGCNTLRFTDDAYARSLSLDERRELAERVVTGLLAAAQGAEYARKRQGLGLVLKKDVPLWDTGYTVPEYMTVSPGGFRIAELLATPAGRRALAAAAAKYSAAGYEILNANLSELNGQAAGA